MGVKAIVIVALCFVGYLAYEIFARNSRRALMIERGILLSLICFLVGIGLFGVSHEGGDNYDFGFMFLSMQLIAVAIATPIVIVEIAVGIRSGNFFPNNASVAGKVLSGILCIPLAAVVFFGVSVLWFTLTRG